MSPEQARRLLEGCGAILSGHFELSSGRHSDLYVEKARILERPEVTAELAREMASWHRGIDVVVAPAVGAIALGFAVAEAAGARSIFTEREDGRMRLRRDFAILPGERVLVVEDVITTGASAGEVYELAREAGAERLGVAALIDRSTAPVGFPFRAVLQVQAQTWAPEACPLCRRGEPFSSRGSRRLRPVSPSTGARADQAEPSS